MVAVDGVNAEEAQRRTARQWLALSLSVLVLAGLFALAVVVGRMPPFDRWVTDPLFFKRCLVAHVNLALIAWFYSFVAALLFLLPVRRAIGRLARASPYVAATGVLGLLIGAGLPDARPLLSNYVPTIDHWTFKAGQVLFGAGVLASVLDRRLLPIRAPETGLVRISAAVRAGLVASGAALVLAALTFGLTWANQPVGLETAVRYDLLVWGGGHVLQLVSTLAMVTVWLLLLSAVLGRSPIGGGAAAALFLALLLPWGFAPVLALEGTSSTAYRVGFTSLMRWGLAPVVSILLVMCGVAVARAWKEGRLERASLSDPRLIGFVVSAGLTVVGFVLGASIRGPNTMIPAHYHASVGAVTVAFMTATYCLIPILGLSLGGIGRRRAAAVQPALYGVGMLLFASGFALAGAHGAERKVYGAEQALRGTAETIGLGLMGVGGFVAIAGGLLFLWIVAAPWLRGAAADRTSTDEPVDGSWRWRYGAQGPG